MKEQKTSRQSTYLVTGGAGFIGSALCRFLLAKKHTRVINIDNLTYAANPLAVKELAAHSNYTHFHHDLSDAKILLDLLKTHQPDAVFHLAAESHVDNSIADAQPFIKTNIEGTSHLLNASLNYWQQLPIAQRREFRFLHVSTDEVYGSTTTKAFTENSIYAPSSPYSASKAAADHLVQAWHTTYGLPTLIAHSSNNYGEYQHGEKLIPRMIFKALKGESLPIFGTGKNIRDWIYVEDHVAALWLIYQRGKKGEHYNIGSQCELENLEVVNHICSYLDLYKPKKQGCYADQITFVKDRLGHDFRYAIDSSKLREELGWKPKHTFAKTLPKTIQWYLTLLKLR